MCSDGAEQAGQGQGRERGRPASSVAKESSFVQVRGIGLGLGRFCARLTKLRVEVGVESVDETIDGSSNFPVRVGVARGWDKGRACPNRESSSSCRV